MDGRRETGEKSVRANQQKLLDWATVNWPRVKGQVEKMQREIFRDAQGNSLSYRAWTGNTKRPGGQSKRTAPKETWRHDGWALGARAGCGESRVSGSAEQGGEAPS